MIWRKLNKKKRHKTDLKSNYLPEYSFPKLQRVGGGYDFDFLCLLLSHRRLGSHVSSEPDQTVKRIISIHLLCDTAKQTDVLIPAS